MVSGKRAVELMLSGWAICGRAVDCWLYGLNSLHNPFLFIFSPSYIPNQFAEPEGSGDAVRLFNFISEWIAASGDSHLFVYRLL